MKTETKKKNYKLNTSFLFFLLLSHLRARSSCSKFGGCCCCCSCCCCCCWERCCCSSLITRSRRRRPPLFSSFLNTNFVVLKKRSAPRFPQTAPFSPFPFSSLFPPLIITNVCSLFPLANLLNLSLLMVQGEEKERTEEEDFEGLVGREGGAGGGRVGGSSFPSLQFVSCGGGGGGGNSIFSMGSSGPFFSFSSSFNLLLLGRGGRYKRRLF